LFTTLVGEYPRREGMSSGIGEIAKMEHWRDRAFGRHGRECGAWGRHEWNVFRSTPATEQRMLCHEEMESPMEVSKHREACWTMKAQGNGEVEPEGSSTSTFDVSRRRPGEASFDSSYGGILLLPIPLLDPERGHIPF
jgi:hypothetical protein